MWVQNQRISQMTNDESTQHLTFLVGHFLSVYRPLFDWIDLFSMGESCLIDEEVRSAKTKLLCC
jgi:hypothetical protein